MYKLYLIQSSTFALFIVVNRSFLLESMDDRANRSFFLLVSSFSDRAHATLFLEGDTGVDATPLSILFSSVYPIRQPLSRPLPTRYIFQLRDRPTYTYQQLSSLPVMLLKGMNCSSVERNWCYLEARFAIYHYSKLIIFDLWRGCRVEGWLWRKDCLIRGQICFDTGRGARNRRDKSDYYFGPRGEGIDSDQV